MDGLRILKKLTSEESAALTTTLISLTIWLGHYSPGSSSGKSHRARPDSKDKKQAHWFVRESLLRPCSIFSERCAMKSHSFKPLLSLTCWLALAFVSAGLVGSCFSMRAYAQPARYFKLQLKHNGQYLDADHCGSPVTLNPGSTFENGACELWRLVPTGDGWNRLQLKHGGQYLDAAYCSTPIGLNPGSTFENGACQLWKFVPAGDGWYRLQLKHGGQYLDADHCTAKLGLNPGSTFENGACQLWRMVPEGQPID